MVTGVAAAIVAPLPELTRTKFWVPLSVWNVPLVTVPGATFVATLTPFTRTLTGVFDGSLRAFKKNARPLSGPLLLLPQPETRRARAATDRNWNRVFDFIRHLSPEEVMG